MNESSGARRMRRGIGVVASTLFALASLHCGGTGSTNPAVQTVTVSSKVVDATGVGVAGLTVRFALGTSDATTAPDGTFSASTVPGAQNLKVLDQGSALLDRAVTVTASGAVSEIPGDIAVQLPAGRVTQKSTVQLPLPPLLVSPPTPSSGEAVTVSFTASSAASTQAKFTGAGCGTLANTAGTTGFQIAGQAGAAGSCQIEAVATSASGQSSSTITQFTVAPAGVAPPALSVAAGEFIPGEPLTPASTSGATPPAISSLTIPGTLINGGTGRLLIDTAAPGGLASIRRIEIAVAGASGHFAAIPQTDENGKLFVDLTLDQSFFTTGLVASARFPGAEPRMTTTDGRLGALALGTTLSLTVQLVDANGNVSAPSPTAIGTRQVGAGTLQFSLSWDTATDVDLHVVEPGGSEIFWAARTSSSGGQLDLDSNAGCAIDHVNNENVTWGSHAPPSGSYVVRVDYWSACGSNPANYVLTVNNCGQVQTFSGSFAAAQQDHGALGAGTVIATIPFTQCSASVAAGRATYEDFPQTPTGLSTVAHELPVRHATVEARRAADDALLKTGETDDDGKFNLQFTNTGAHGYYVAVVAQQDNAIVKEKVVDNQSAIYTKRSETVDESLTPRKLDFAIKATKADGSAPAFNIFDVGLLAASVVRNRLGVTPPLLTWLWTGGQHGTCNGPVSCYSQDGISVLSDPQDPDEYDDLVLLHEFGHFVQDHYSKSDSPGGAHGYTGQYDPRLAWSEGSATFFGNFARGTTLYIDTNASSALTVDLETPDPSIPRGTSDGKQTGNLSEIVVAAILWDLADAANGTASADHPAPHDTVTNPDGVFEAFTYVRRIPSSDASARDPVGVDLVDFLDGWFCVGNGERGDANTGVQGIVNGVFNFPYDYATNCR
jgi:hypothetical protein